MTYTVCSRHFISASPLVASGAQSPTLNPRAPSTIRLTKNVLILSLSKWRMVNNRTQAALPSKGMRMLTFLAFFTGDCWECCVNFRLQFDRRSRSKLHYIDGFHRLETGERDARV